MIVLAVTLVLLYFLGIFIGSSIEKQRWKDQKEEPQPDHENPAISPDVFSESPAFTEYQQVFNAGNEAAWEQRAFSNNPHGRKIDLFA